MADNDKRTGDRPHRAGAFDIRIFIGALLGLYGVILVLAGFLATSDQDLERAGGANVNLWTGIGLVVFSAFFIAWARLRPVVVPPSSDRDDDAG